MTKEHTWQDTLDEIEAISKFEYEAYQREKQNDVLDVDICLLDGHEVGHLNELPLWAQSYIKWLRRQAK